MNSADSIPSAYLPGYEKARKQDPETADNYIAHTLLGDPEADAAVEALAPWGPKEGGRFIEALMDQRQDIPHDAPKPLRDFFEQLEAPPPSWFDPEAVMPGCRAFHADSTLFTGAFVSAVLIEGFTTLIAKSFFMTGRLTSFGVRRLQQNNRHLVEIFLPGGLERQGDGWKLSVRIRLIHAQLRRLLVHSPAWDTAAWGMPLSAAHIGFATATFSAKLLNRARRFGVILNAEERRSFMMIWRYTGYLLGVPETILFRNEEEAHNLYQVGHLCEPPPGFESIILTNCLVNSAPVVAGITDPGERRRLANYIYSVSRAQIGDEMADQLRYPPGRTRGLLTFMYFKNRFWRAVGAIFPRIAQKLKKDKFLGVMDVSMYDKEGITYKMPDKVDAEQSGNW